MRFPPFVLFFALLAGLCCVRPTSGQDLNPEEIRRTIEQGVAFLKSRQKPDGSWDEMSTVERCGSTALALLAMINCGLDKEDPALRRGMQFLRQHRGTQTGRNYAISLQTMVYCLVDPDRDRALIRENVQYLEQAQVRTNELHAGGWSYTPGTGGSDLSNSQFTMLALYEAERVGVSVQKTTWQRAYRYWSVAQNSDGSWGYGPIPGGGSREIRGSMTCAGLASLMMISSILGEDGASVRGDSIQCMQPVDGRISQQIERGMNWLIRNFSVSENPRYGQWLFYYLYALERVGRMSNRRFIGKDDWYRAGADKILALRDRAVPGSWRSSQSGPVVATSFALLFLSKGRRPVLMSKLEYGNDLSWNVHPNDVNNLTLFTESQWKMELTWQNIALIRATPEDLLQSPVLYLCGSLAPLRTKEEDTVVMAAALREYIDQGGFLWAEAQPDDKGFDAGFRTLIRAIFPEPGYELTLLEESHPIWSAEIPIEPDQIRPIEGINFGCRTSVVYVPPYPDPSTKRNRPSLSCLWEVADPIRRHGHHTPPVQRQIDAGLGIGLNILAYATNRELKYKDQIAETVTKRMAADDLKRGRIFIALLDQGDANAAPRAVPNILQWAEANLGIPVEQHCDTVTVNSENLFEYPILFMHGRGAFEFSPQGREKLRKHLEAGGFLFANAICSTKAFNDAFLEEMKKLFPDNPAEPIPTEDPLLREEYGGFHLDTLELRVPERAPGRKMVAPKRSVTPELYGIRVEGRLAVVFSPNDVSCSLESAGSLECRGYTRESAMRLSVNILLYALEHW